MCTAPVLSPTRRLVALDCSALATGVASGLLRIAVPARPSTLVTRVADALAKVEAPVSILIASGDATAIAFADAWRQNGFAAARERISLTQIESDSHSFARDDDYAALMAMLKRALD